MRRFAGLVCAAFALTGGANAAVLDFVEEAAVNGERGVADGTVINFDGLDVTFSSLSGGAFFAYFDDEFNGLPGGLGVCETLVAGDGSKCATRGDDNIRSGEAVTLTFDENVTVSNFSFSDKEHRDLNSNGTNSLWIAINDPNAFVSYSFADAVALVVSDVTLIRFAFGEDGNGLQYYVNGFTASPVPLPAAAPFLLAGIAGLAFAGRRNKSAA